MPEEDFTPSHMLPFRGLMWSDMPGYDKEDKKLTFALLRMGKYDPDMDGSLSNLRERSRSLSLMAQRKQRIIDCCWSMNPSVSSESLLQEVEDRKIKPRVNWEDLNPACPQYRAATSDRRLNRQLKLKERYDQIEKPRGWVKRFRDLAKIDSGHTPKSFNNDIPLMDDTLDRIEAAICILESESKGNERSNPEQ